MRRPRHQEPVLAGRGLALGAVHDDRSRCRAPSNRAHLGRHGKTRATAAAQTASLELAEHGGPLVGPGEARQVPHATLMLGE
jgi:hypothetical protein